jgi:hypothetical protein
MYGTRARQRRLNENRYDLLHLFFATQANLSP